MQVKVIVVSPFDGEDETTRETISMDLEPEEARSQVLKLKDAMEEKFPLVIWRMVQVGVKQYNIIRSRRFSEYNF